MEHRLSKIAQLWTNWHPTWVQSVIERLSPSHEAAAVPKKDDVARAEPDRGQPLPDFGPAPGGYGPASAPGTALGGKGIFGPDVSEQTRREAESAEGGTRPNKNHH